MEILFYSIVVTLLLYSGYRCHRASEKKKLDLERIKARRELVEKLQEIRKKRKRYSDGK